ncbi:MAG: aldolase/citrate lyase family protein [Pseudomonas sp.]
MTTNLFKRALAAGQAQIGLWSTLPSPYVTEMLAGAGFDWLLLDAEHAPTDVMNMLGQLQAVAAARSALGAAPSAVVRPPWNDPVLIKRYLDIGAQNLLIPFVQTAEEARAAVAACRFAPLGVRGMGGSVRAAGFGRDSGYVARAHEEVGVFVQVETAEALERIEAIAAVDGVDGIFIGPADLSASMGHAGAVNHPEVKRAVDDAVRRIARCGKAPGILMVDEARARELLELGALFVAVAIDLVLLRTAVDQKARAFSERLSESTPTSY